MSDIVFRLRQMMTPEGELSPIGQEASDEIVRLRQLLSGAAGLLEMYGDDGVIYPHERDLITEIKKEIDR